MNHLRVLNVFTLSALLILTGCFGLMPETEADSESDSDEYEMPHTNWRVESMGIQDNEWMIYYVIYDPSDFLSATGIDYNSDGVVDVQTTNSSGFLTIQTSLLNSNLHAEEFVRVYDMTFIGTADSEVIFSEILVEGLDEYPENDYSWYEFSAVDSNGAPTTATDDNLIRVTMDQGSDLNWASVSISISVNGAAPITCSNPGLDGADCSAVEFGDTSDNVWSVGDGITISESGQDLCSEGTCEVEVRIIDTREGITIDTASAIAQ